MGSRTVPESRQRRSHADGADSASPSYNSGREPIYPTGLAVSSDGETWCQQPGRFARHRAPPRRPRPELRTVNLDSGATAAIRLSMRRAGRCRRGPPRQGVRQLLERQRHRGGGCAPRTRHDPNRSGRAPERHGRHGGQVAPLRREREHRHRVAIDTRADREVLRIGVGLERGALAGSSRARWRLSDDGRVLFVAHRASRSRSSRSVPTCSPRPIATTIDTARMRKLTVLTPAPESSGSSRRRGIRRHWRWWAPSCSSATARARPSRPNAPTDVSSQREAARGVCAVALPQQPAPARHPEPAALGALTTRVLQANGLIGERVDGCLRAVAHRARHLHHQGEPHVDQVFGDLASGDGTRADGDPSLALFGAGEAARVPVVRRRISRQIIAPSLSIRAVRPVLRQLRSQPRRAQLVHGRLLHRLRGQGVPLELLRSRPHLRLRGPIATDLDGRLPPD